MGYSYGMDARGRFTRLACDSCGAADGTTRKRTCRFKVRYFEGGALPYCPAPALCPACFTKHGGSKGIHGDSCRDGAARSQAREDERGRRRAAGELEVKSAFGDWHETVPKGMTGVRFVGGAPTPHVINSGTTEAWKLMPAGAYEPGAKPWLSDYAADGLTDWTGHP